MKVSTRPDAVPWVNRVAAFVLFLAGLTCVGVATYLLRVGGWDARVFLLMVSAAGLFVGYGKMLFGR